MRRRSLLGAVAAGLAGTAGCNGAPTLPGGRSDVDGETRTPSPGRSSTGEAGTTGRPGGTVTSGPTDGTDTPASTPYRRPGAPTVDSPRGVGLKNRGRRTRFVTVAVADGDRTVFVESRSFPPGTQATYADLVVGRGTYRVVVETADGARRATRWPVEPGFDGLSVHLTDEGIRVWRDIHCGPGCPPVTGAASDPSPLVPDEDDRWPAPATLFIENVAGRDERVEAGVSRDGEPLFRRTYRLPRGVRALVPVSHRAGRYAVRVVRDGRRHRYDWHVPEQRRFHVRLPPAPGTTEASCGRPAGVVHVRNEGERARSVTLGLRREGEAVAERRFEVPAGEGTTTDPLVREGGRYTLVVRTGTGASATAEWWACPPRGPAAVVLGGDGDVRIRTQ